VFVRDPPRARTAQVSARDAAAWRDGGSRGWHTLATRRVLLSRQLVLDPTLTHHTFSLDTAVCGVRDTGHTPDTDPTDTALASALTHSHTLKHRALWRCISTSPASPMAVRARPRLLSRGRAPRGGFAFYLRQKRNEWFTFATHARMSRGGRAPRSRASLHISAKQSAHTVGGWHRVRGLLNRDLAVRSTSSRTSPVWRSPHGAATACCLSDAVRSPAHVACGFAQWLSGKDSRAPACPLNHDTKQLSMDLCVSSLALAASLTSQYWSNWSRGRLPDLG
jgi:hypothetical protein